ncbi:MAG: hypothetical protein FJ029_10815 [Actinobacteria bacterium]|nr:hypothetical protein [Actinomycetota bacterium]
MKRASVWPIFDPAALTLDQALELLAYPKVLGHHPATGAQVTLQDGPHGPYVRCGDAIRSVPGHGDERYAKLRTTGLEEALAWLAAPRPTGILRELGKDPSGADVVVKDGRYGPYVTDGKLNATIPRGRDPLQIELDDALALLAKKAARPARRSRPPRRAGP